MEIELIIDSIYPISIKAKAKLTEAITEVKCKKGTLLFLANKPENVFYFIKKGVARAYAQKESADVTFWFGTEGDFLLSMKSYVNKEHSYENIEALEDMSLYKIQTDTLQSLYLKDIEIANWGRKFAEKELIKTEERLIELQFKTAKERYLNLLNSRPDLIQRVQLGYIASFLGITQVSLSRIRASITH